MTFTSIAFVVFFIVVTCAYYLCPKRGRWFLLLAASCYFYIAFVPKYIFILFGLIVIDFFMALLIERSEGKSRKVYLVISIVANIGILFTFKYFNFFNENISALAAFLHWNYSISALQLILPLGLSFHTFQSLSYVIEVYRKNYKAERHIGIYALYVMFFPQLVAGPIERPQHLLPQLKKDVAYDWPRIFSGLRLMGWGFFEKMVIADRLAIAVDYVYGHVGHVPGLSVVLAIIFFSFQLYADFAGYSDIARGSARVFGIDIVRNFNRPYFSTSVAEFWRRWHMSLSNWFRDYLYYPLVYSARRLSRGWLYFSIIFTFTVMGLWHGAGWTFITMGAFFGCYIALSTMTQGWRRRFVAWVGLSAWPRLHRVLQIFFLFGLVSFTWIFFRAPDMSTAFGIIKNVFTGWNMSFSSLISNYFLQPFNTLGFARGDMILAVGGILFLIFVEWLQGRQSLTATIERQPLVVRSFVYSGLVLAIIVFAATVNKQFIYFQF